MDIQLLLVKSPKPFLVTPSPQGLVMAVHGPWGAGKSTLLNFVKCHLEETKEDSPILVIDFNPWWFNDKNHLVNQFLSTFQSSLKLAPSALQKVGDIMAKYSDALAATATTSAGAPWASKIVAWLLSKLNIKTEDVPQLKSKIAKALFESNTRVLFLIDDIDRLAPDEIRELFKAIKAIADFPNVIYLLSFDRDVVQLALNKSLGIDGASYLEKIVQVPFSLPSIDKILLRQQLFTNLSRVLESFPDIKFDEVYWHNVYMDGLDLFIEKPRDVVRLTNIFCVTFPPVAGEVNVVDFIALEFLRIFAPQVYETIRDNMDMFAGHSRQNRDAEDPLLVFHNTWLSKVSEVRRPAMKELVARIFPKAASAWGRIGYESDSVPIWRNELRVCCADLFDIYFQFGLSPDYLSRSELNNLLAVAENPGMAANILLAANLTIRASGRSKAADYIDRLRDIQDELTSAKAIGLLTALFEIGDDILGQKDDSQGVFFMPNSWRVSFLVNHLFKYIPADGRHLQLRQLVSNGKAIGLSITTVDRIRRNIEKPEDDSVFSVINEQLFNDLRSIVHDRLNRMPSLDFLKLREMSTVIFIWLAWGYQKDVQTKMVPLFTADALLPQTLEKFLQVGRAQVMGDHGAKRTLRMNPNNISEIIDIEAIAPKIQSMLNNSDLTPDQKYAGEDYLKNLDRIRNGENVDRFGD